MSPLRDQPTKDAMSKEINKPARKDTTWRDEDVKGVCTKGEKVFAVMETWGREG